MGDGVFVCNDFNFESYFSGAVEGELVSGGGGLGGDGDLDGVMEGEEGGGWEVGDDDLDLPPDLVSAAKQKNVTNF